MPVRVVTDSTADLEPERVEALAITVVPLNVHFGQELFQDGVTISKEQFYERLPESEALPHTSQPSPAEFKLAYEALGDAEGIVSVHIGGKLSGTINAARQGAEMLDESHPPIAFVDSDQASLGLGYAVQAAAEAARDGGNFEQVTDAARDAAHRCRVVLFVDTLEYLQKGGRIGRARAFLGTLLRTKPLLELRGGEIEGIERPRTRQRAIDRLFAQVMRSPRPEKIGILYGSTPLDAYQLAERVREAEPEVEVEVVRASPVIGVHTGPGALGAAILRSR